MSVKDSLNITAKSLREMVEVLKNWDKLSEAKRQWLIQDLIRDVGIAAEMLEIMARGAED